MTPSPPAPGASLGVAPHASLGVAPHASLGVAPHAGSPPVAARAADRQLVGATSLQRSAAAPASAGAGAVATAARRSMTAAVTAADGPMRSASPGSPPVTSLQRSADPVAAGIAQRTADGSVVFDQAVRSQLLSGTTVTVGAGEAGDGDGGAAIGEVPVQRSASAPPPLPSADVAIAAPVLQPELGNPPLGPATRPQGGGPADLDELAKQLYGRIRTQLAAELRIDRERAGLGVGAER